MKKLDLTIKSFLSAKNQLASLELKVTVLKSEIKKELRKNKKQSYESKQYAAFLSKYNSTIFDTAKLSDMLSDAELKKVKKTVKNERLIVEKK